MTLEELLGNMIEKYGEDEFTWGFVPPAQSEGPLVRELYSELSETHPLRNHNIRLALAKCYANDDVLFLGEDGAYYIVHLTYSKTNSLGYPRYLEFLNLEAAMTHIEEQYLLSLNVEV